MGRRQHEFRIEGFLFNFPGIFAAVFVAIFLSTFFPSFQAQASDRNGASSAAPTEFFLKVRSKLAHEPGYVSTLWPKIQNGINYYLERQGCETLSIPKTDFTDFETKKAWSFPLYCHQGASLPSERAYRDSVFFERIEVRVEIPIISSAELPSLRDIPFVGSLFSGSSESSGGMKDHQDSLEDLRFNDVRFEIKATVYGENRESHSDKDLYYREVIVLTGSGRHLTKLKDPEREYLDPSTDLHASKVLFAAGFIESDRAANQEADSGNPPLPERKNLKPLREDGPSRKGDLQRPATDHVASPQNNPPVATAPAQTAPPLNHHTAVSGEVEESPASSKRSHMKQSTRSSREGKHRHRRRRHR